MLLKATFPVPNATIFVDGKGRWKRQAKYLAAGYTRSRSSRRMRNPRSFRRMVRCRCPIGRAIIGKRGPAPWIHDFRAGFHCSESIPRSARSCRAKDWTHEISSGPIYFLMTGDAYVCGLVRIGQKLGMVDSDPPSTVTCFSSPNAGSNRKGNRKHGPGLSSWLFD